MEVKTGTHRIIRAANGHHSPPAGHVLSADELRNWTVADAPLATAVLVESPRPVTQLVESELAKTALTDAEPGSSETDTPKNGKMSTLIVVNNPKEWPFNIPGVEVVDARGYLTRPEYSDLRGVKLFNLCRSYRYQSLGYYVTLLAAARGHKPLPKITTIQDP